MRWDSVPRKKILNFDIEIQVVEFLGPTWLQFTPLSNGRYDIHLLQIYRYTHF